MSNETQTKPIWSREALKSYDDIEDALEAETFARLNEIWFLAEKLAGGEPVQESHVEAAKMELAKALAVLANQYYVQFFGPETSGTDGLANWGIKS